MIILQSDNNPERAEVEFETESTMMILMAITAAGINCEDLQTFKENNDLSVDAYIEAQADPEVTKPFIEANSQILADNGIQVKNELQEAEEGAYPLIITTVTNCFEKFNVVAQIQRGLVCDEESIKLYTGSVMGFEIENGSE